MIFQSLLLPARHIATDTGADMVFRSMAQLCLVVSTDQSTYDESYQLIRIVLCFAEGLATDIRQHQKNIRLSEDASRLGPTSAAREYKICPWLVVVTRQMQLRALTTQSR